LSSILEETGTGQLEELGLLTRRSQGNLSGAPHPRGQYMMTATPNRNKEAPQLPPRIACQTQ